MTLHEARAAKKLTQERLAELCETTQATISDLERGRTAYPDLDLAVRIAHVLEVDPLDLWPVDLPNTSEAVNA